jgi:signal transduction histidine kinase
VAGVPIAAPPGFAVARCVPMLAWTAVDESVNMEPVMTIGSGAVAEPPVAKRRFVRGLGGGPLVSAVAKAPVSVRTKLLVGFGAIVILLAVVAATGLLALRQSNSRVQQLRSVQQEATLVQGLLADATILQSLVQHRAIFTVASGTQGVTPEPDAYYNTLDATIWGAWAKLKSDLATTGGVSLSTGFGYVVLQRLNPALYARLTATLKPLTLLKSDLDELDAEGRGAGAVKLVARLQTLTTGYVSALTPAAQRASARADELAAQNRSSFATSRKLLIGVSAGSLALALALGLLISWSLVVPLRRTGTRMSEIAAGDFEGHLDVPNRDEIGTLATNVNQMSGELGHLYQELESASRHKSDFLATMSHELRTPLNAIIGFSELLHEQMFGELNEQQLSYVQDILDAGRHLLSMINDVLDLAKIEAGRMELEPSEVALPEVLRSAVSMHSEQAKRRGVALGLTTDPEEIAVFADDRRVRQVVFNLVSNAIKFTPPDGRVDVSARLENGAVEIAVADTGPGIPAEDQESIFQEFEQSAAGKEVEGTGLGLPLSRKLVELHGGRLWVESEVGQGSTFRFTLPLEQGA